jgi:hypothetical protein
VQAQKYPFGKVSNRDDAYLAMYASQADKDGVVTLDALKKLGKNPFYGGSNKAADAGCLIRHTKAKTISSFDGGKGCFTLAPDALTRGRTIAAEARKAAAKAE